MSLKFISLHMVISAGVKKCSDCGKKKTTYVIVEVKKQDVREALESNPCYCGECFGKHIGGDE